MFWSMDPFSKTLMRFSNRKLPVTPFKQIQLGQVWKPPDFQYTYVFTTNVANSFMKIFLALQFFLKTSYVFAKHAENAVSSFLKFVSSPNLS